MVTDYVNAHDVPPANVRGADETGMGSGSVPLRTRVDTATMGAGVLREGDNRRDTGMMALSAGGSIDAELLPCQPQVTRRVGDQTVIVQKEISGMGTPQMKSWTQCFLGRHREDEPSVLIMDRLECHQNREVLAQLQAGKIESFLLPPQAAKLIPPLR
jgi:hypothetical protein